MITLYDYPFSGNGYKVRLTLSELGIPYAYRVIDILQGEQATPAFKAINPFGQIPAVVLEDGGALADSSAIIWYFAEGTALLPEGRLEQAHVRAWMGFEQTHVDGVISRARFRRRFPEVIPTREEEFVSWLREGNRALDVLEAAVTASEWLVGGAFGLADITLYAYVHVAEEGGFELGSRPAIRDWCRRIQARPRWVGLYSPPSGSASA